MFLRRNMLSLEKNAHTEDYGGKDFWPDDVLAALEQSDSIFFKEDPRWLSQYKTLKIELNRREHIPNKDERRRTRQENAKSAGNREKCYKTGK